MPVKMRVQERRINMSVGRERRINMSVGLARILYIGGEPYEGTYDVTPKANSAQKLPTSGKLLTDDITVRKIPYYEVGNSSGGTTIYIGSDDELIIE